jgi:hypothetical protein
VKLAEDFDEAFAAVECGNAFLPFIGGEAERIEQFALAAKRCLDLHDQAVVDPWDAAKRIDVDVLGHKFFDQFPEDLRRQILSAGSAHWSAGTVVVPPHAAIVLNPTHSLTRQRATLAEELAHLVMGHPPSRIDPVTGFRTFEASIESEAFGVGGAMILPYSRLFALVNRGATAGEIANQFSISEQFAEYRINRAGLRRVHRKRQSA